MGNCATRRGLFRWALSSTSTPITNKIIEVEERRPVRSVYVCLQSFLLKKDTKIENPKSSQLTDGRLNLPSISREFSRFHRPSETLRVEAPCRHCMQNYEKPNTFIKYMITQELEDRSEERRDQTSASPAVVFSDKDTRRERERVSTVALLPRSVAARTRRRILFLAGCSREFRGRAHWPLPTNSS